MLLFFVGVKMLKKLLTQLFLDDIIVNISQKDGRYFVRLKEQGKDAKLRQVDIYGIESDVILLNMDKYKNQQYVFKGQLGENKRCDYLLLTEIHGKKIMLFIELKSKTFKNSEVIKKFKATECFINYCHDILNKFLNNNSLKEYIKLYVLFYKHNTSKRRTRPKILKLTCHYSNPEECFKYSSPSSQFSLSLKKLIQL